MKKYLFLIYFICAFYTPALSQIQIAILEPIAMSNDVKVIEQAIVRGELTKAICREKYYSAFSRIDFDYIVKEQNFQQSGVVDAETRKRLGAMHGVDYLCVVKISKRGSLYYIEANFVDVETGEILGPATIYGELQANNYEPLQEKCTQLANDLLNSNVSYNSKIYKVRQMQTNK